MASPRVGGLVASARRTEATRHEELRDARLDERIQVAGKYAHVEQVLHLHAPGQAVHVGPAAAWLDHGLHGLDRVQDLARAVHV
jgi:hypothetical protein